MKAVIIDYGSGNLHSTLKAFEKAAEVTGHEVVLTDNAFELQNASHIVLPGVGAFGDCMAGLLALEGMLVALEHQVLEQRKPFLGICVGMQLLAEKSYEHGEHKGLGWIPGEVVPIMPEDPQLKIPHMGWNELEITGAHPIISGLDHHDHAYFVHSFYMVCEDSDDVVAEVGYGGKLTAVVARDNIMGTQFHPEKSQRTGLQLITNFLMME